MKLSRLFIERLKLSLEPAQNLALEVGMDPETLSKLVHRRVRIEPHVRMITDVGRLLRLKPEEVIDYEFYN